MYYSYQLLYVVLLFIFILFYIYLIDHDKNYIIDKKSIIIATKGL